MRPAGGRPARWGAAARRPDRRGREARHAPGCRRRRGDRGSRRSTRARSRGLPRVSCRRRTAGAGRRSGGCRRGGRGACESRRRRASAPSSRIVERIHSSSSSGSASSTSERDELSRIRTPATATPAATASATAGSIHSAWVKATSTSPARTARDEATSALRCSASAASATEPVCVARRPMTRETKRLTTAETTITAMPTPIVWTCPPLTRRASAS